MDNIIVDVKLWGQMVGSLVWDSAMQMAVFEYDNTFRRNGIEPAPLTMPLSYGNRPFSTSCELVHLLVVQNPKPS